MRVLVHARGVSLLSGRPARDPATTRCVRPAAMAHRRIRQEEIAGPVGVLTMHETSKPWDWSRRSERRAAELKSRQKYRETAPIGDFQYVLAIEECIAKGFAISRDETFSGLNAVGLENGKVIAHPRDISRA